MRHTIEVNGYKKSVTGYRQGRAIRFYCLDCANTSEGVRACGIGYCKLYQLRFGKSVKGVQPLKRIRKYCLWCVMDNAAEVARCPSSSCPLFPYRFGRGPRVSDPGYRSNEWGPVVGKEG